MPGLGLGSAVGLGKTGCWAWARPASATHASKVHEVAHWIGNFKIGSLLKKDMAFKGQTP